MSEATQEDFSNLAAHLEGMPPVYDKPPQDDTARAYAQSLMRILRSGRRPDKQEMEWLTLYNRHKAKSRNRDEADEYIEEYNKKDIHMFFMDKIAKLQTEYEERLRKQQSEHNAIIKEKDKRIDEIIAKSEEQKLKDFARLQELLINNNSANLATVERANNTANGHLVTALGRTNELNNTILSSLSSQWKQAGDLSKKNFEELNKMLEQKEKEEPGFFETFFTEIILPNQDKISNAINRLATPLLQNK